MAARGARRSRVNPSFSGSLPGFPDDVDVEDWLQDAMPLPDHFPDPYEDDELVPNRKVKESSVDPPNTRSRASVTLERGATLVFCPAPPSTSPSPQKTPTSPQPPTTSPKPTLTCLIFPASPTSSSTHSTPTSTTPTNSTPTTPTTPTPTSRQPADDSSSELEVTMRRKPPKTLPKPLVTSSTSASVVTSRSGSVVSSPVVKMPDSGERGEGADSKEGVRRITDKYAAPAALMRNGPARSTNPLPSSSSSTSSSHRDLRPPSSPAAPRPPSRTSSTLSRQAHKPPSSPKAPQAPSRSSSFSTNPPAVRRKDSLPPTPTPFITLTPCPSNGQPEVSLVTVNVSPARSRLSIASNKSTTAGAQSWDSAASGEAEPRDSLSLTLPDVVGVRSSGSGHSLSSMSMSAFKDMTWDPQDPACDSPFSEPGGGGGSVGGDGGDLGVVLPVPLVPEASGLLGTCRYQSVSGIPLTASLGEGVTKRDVQQVEMFYRSQSTQVTVCRCLANLYLGSAGSKASSRLPCSPPSAKNNTISNSTGGRVSSSIYSDLWQFISTGLPVLVLDSGCHRRSRRLLLVLAEKGTGFVLWKDDVTPFSRYSCPESNFHTLSLSSDVSKVVGLSFDDSKAASDFSTYVTRQMTSEFDGNDSGTLKKKKRKKKKKADQQREKSGGKYKPPKKTEISKPCCFQHVTRLERPQVTGVLPLPPAHTTLTAGFRDRLSLSSRTHSYSSDLSEALTITSEQ